MKNPLLKEDQGKIIRWIREYTEKEAKERLKKGEKALDDLNKLRNDEAVLKVIKYLQNEDDESVSFSAIYSVLRSNGFNIDKGHLERKLESLKKYGKIKKTTKSSLPFYKLIG